MDTKDHSLEYLIDLNGEIAEVGGGFWVKFNIRRIKVDKERPYGIKYSLTLHNEKGERVLGYDNAHASYENKKRDEFDHIHKGERIKRYNYSSAEKLMEDFWKDVNKFLKDKE